MNDKAESWTEGKEPPRNLVFLITATCKIAGIVAIWPIPDKGIFKACCSKVIMSGVNGNVILEASAVIVHFFRP
jgi:hypothetical protein